LIKFGRNLIKIGKKVTKMGQNLKKIGKKNLKKIGKTKLRQITCHKIWPSSFSPTGRTTGPYSPLTTPSEWTMTSCSSWQQIKART
jgi:hypothetical protein